MAVQWMWRNVGGLVVVAALLAGAVAADQPELERGTLVERVTCTSQPEFSYSLYLPSGYSEERRWPVIYCFAPSGDGSRPLRLLMDAAETFGYILVGSNDARNGPWEPVFAAQRALWKDVNKRFAVDSKRSYATGFSGGARASVELALAHRGRVAGLILCGAVFSPLHPFPRQGDFAVYGLVGDGDPNLEENIRAATMLAGYTQWHEVFAGNHRWPDAQRFQEAVEFLEIDAMRRGLKPVDEVFINHIADKRLAGGHQLRRAGRPLLALRRFRQTAELFAGSDTGARAAAAAAKLEADAEVARLSEAEQQFVDDLALLNDWRQYAPFREAAERMQQRVAEGDRLGERARAVLHLISIFLDRAGVQLLQQGKPDEAAPTLHIAATLYLPNAVASYNAACAFALTGEKETALRFLQAAAANGFNNADLLATDADLASLRDHQRLDAILALVQQNQEQGRSPERYDFGPRGGLTQ